MWYLLHIVMQDPAAQRKGYVILTNSRAGTIGGLDTKFSSQAAEFGQGAFPVRWKTLHVCHAFAIFPLVSQATGAILRRSQRRSIFLHNGTDEHVLENLSEHGLPRNRVPQDLGE